MYIKTYYLITGCIVLTFTSSLLGQIPTIQDCLGAISICQPIYTESQSPSGDGNYVDELNTDFTCLSFESNAIWYTFTTNSDGNFGFLVTPNTISNDFDWALYNITDATCADIKTNENLLISCNAAGGSICNGGTGATGGTIYNFQGGGCFNDPPNINSGLDPENALVAVQENNTYVLMVSNWTGSTAGYTIDFGISDVDIFDTKKPALIADDFPNGCFGDEILLEFDENILCSSIVNSNFSLNGPSGSHALIATSDLCETGTQYDRFIRVTTDPPITESGFYTLSFCCLEDACGNLIEPVVLNYNVSIIAPAVVDLGPDQTLCLGESITLNATNPSAQYDWSTGEQTATIDVSTSGAYEVIVTNSCSVVSDVIEIEIIEAPDFNFDDVANLCAGETLTLDASADNATYNWSTGDSSPTIIVDSEGQYSVTAINQCGELSDQIQVNFDDQPSIDFGPDLLICEGQTIQLSIDFLGGDIIWQDNSTGTSFDVLTPGTYGATVSNSCGSASDEIQIDIIEAPMFDLGPEQFVCDGDIVILTAEGSNANFNWSTGESSSSINVTSTGLYTVLAENQCGSFEDQVQINFNANVQIDFAPMLYLCDPITLKAAEDYEFAEYIWQDGSTGQNFEVTEPGEYFLELSSGCKVERDTILVLACEECNVYFPNIFSPNNDGMNDEFIIASPCGFDTYTLIVFDRWGNQVFQSRDVSDSWDGRKNGSSLTPGVYSYFLDYSWTVNGNTEQHKKTGTITLLSN